MVTLKRGFPGKRKLFYKARHEDAKDFWGEVQGEVQGGAYM